MIERLIRFAALALTATMLSSCANEPFVRSSAVRVDYGSVEAIEIYRSSDGEPIRVRTVVGGEAGSVMGHQIASGGGNTVATIGGTIGGAAVGQGVGREVSGSRYRITVRLDSGSKAIIEDSRNVHLRVGDRVGIENDRVFRL